MSNGTVSWNREHASSVSTRAIARLVRRITGAGALVLLILLASTDRAEAQCVYCGQSESYMEGSTHIEKVKCETGGYARICATRRVRQGRSIVELCEERGQCRRGEVRYRLNSTIESWAWSETRSVKAPPCSDSPTVPQMEANPYAPKVQSRLTVTANDWE